MSFIFVSVFLTLAYVLRLNEYSRFSVKLHSVNNLIIYDLETHRVHFAQSSITSIFILPSLY